ncbi:MAG: hypothetical protein ABR549_16340, partial [Mycobacteriales bacterium]
MTTAEGTGESAKRPRGPGATYTALAVAMMVGLALFAYSVPQQPPPTIAAFAPQPKKLIVQPPPEQTTIGDDTTKKGRGNGGTGGLKKTDKAKPPKLTPKAPIEVPRQRDCIGQLQIDDPQSPPCVPGFIGDNGGATSFGVTKDAITIAVSQNMINYTGQQVVDDLFRFFNKRFEFY